MNVLIVEDEPLIAKNLERLLQKLDAGIQVLATLNTVSATVEWLNTHPQPNLIFMDIQLSDGVSFDVFEKTTVTAPVIFTTAYNEYAIRAFKVNSVDYLLKPIDKDELARALDKYRQLYGTDTTALQQQVQALLTNIQQQNTPRYRERFLAHYKAGIVPVQESKVAYFIKDTIIYLVTTDNEKLVTDYNTMDEIEEMVDPHRFFRVNRQAIVHINQVETYKKHDTGKIEVTLRSDHKLHLDVSREKAHAFVEWLSK